MEMHRESRERDLISIVSYLYYYAEMNQSDIADRLFLSRSTVSRIIKKARQSGAVEIKINEPWDRDLEMEDIVKTTFSVDSVRVLQPESDKPEQYLRSLGKMASYYLSCNLKHNSVLGLSWGNTVAHVVDSITNNENITFTVVPIMGSNNWPSTNPENVSLSYRFSRIYGGRYFPLDAPLYAVNQEQYDELTNRLANTEALNVARKANMILTSVGSIRTQSWKDVLGMERLQRLCDIGCVGHIGGHFFDISGREIDGHYKNMLIGLTLTEIKQTNNVVCVAADSEKAKAVYGAIRGKLINTLMITSPLATKLLEIAGQRTL